MFDLGYASGMCRMVVRAGRGPDLRRLGTSLIFRGSCYNGGREHSHWSDKLQSPDKHSLITFDK